MISEDDFRAEALAFLEANAKRRQAEVTGWGKGTDRVGVLEEKTPEEERKEVADAKAWRQAKFDAGFGWITGPGQYGGRELPATFERSYQATEAQFDTASQSPF